MVVGGKPEWLKVRGPLGDAFPRVRELLQAGGISTVCDSAHCPNISDCWSRHHATFMVLGRCCTRDCAFCAVEHGTPQPVDAEEPMKIASVVAELGLRHVVVTSVTRDDLPDQGAGHYRAVVEAIRDQCPKASIELLLPDMRSSERDIRTVVESRPDMLGHNIETVRRLQGIRDRRSTYERSLETLRTIKDIGPSMTTKSAIMLGLGERHEEVVGTLRDLREVGTDAVVIGQYLRPRGSALEVYEYVHPDTFRELAQEARALGFRHVASGPLMRSSYPVQEQDDKENGPC